MKLAFVTPWYGDIPGGAENLCKHTAEKLALSGLDVEVLTTCVKDFHSDWNLNYYKEGTYEINSVVVRRFKVRERNSNKFNHINNKLMQNQHVSLKEEHHFMQEMINSDDLCSYIRRCGENYTYFIFIPYMFGTSYYGSKIYPSKSILIPCLHDESYAYLNIYKSMLESVSGVIFNSDPEKDFANSLFNLKSRQVVIGDGVDTDIKYSPNLFRKKYGISDKFILYAGRREPGKNVPLLLEYFCKYKENTKNDLKLILIGSGQVDIPRIYKNDIIDLGFVPKEDIYSAFSAASILCQPSVNESFSIVIMESWLCKTPVLVNENCSVTKNHCIKSNGGLYFKDYTDFEGCINYYMDHPEMSDRMAKNGMNYVKDNYNWETIIKKYKRFLGV
jgi:glycosyltransferase involved in cell wall biosynthesis